MIYQKYCSIFVSTKTVSKEIMEKELEKIGLYLKNRVLNNDFKFISIDDYNITIVIDGYYLEIWIGNGQDNFRFNNSTYSNVINHKSLAFSREDQSILLKVLTPYFEISNEEIERQIEELKTKLK